MENKLRLKIVPGGFAIARWVKEGFLEQLSYPFPTIEMAKQYLSIANYELRFIPSALPVINERFINQFEGRGASH
jgi:hypothetical protein